jgi:hypothetical protein
MDEELVGPMTERASDVVDAVPAHEASIEYRDRGLALRNEAAIQIYDALIHDGPRCDAMQEMFHETRFARTADAEVGIN